MMTFPAWVSLLRVRRALAKPFGVSIRFNYS